MGSPRLTQLSPAGGCGCKIGLNALVELLADEVAEDEGITRFEDAACLPIGDGENTMVSTVDFFAPMVDDPYSWGAITASNALSDIYAMGADPVLALQILVWPQQEVPVEIMKTVLRGAREQLQRAGCRIGGGHTISGPVPLLGFSVLGSAATSHLLRNDRAQVGDVVILSKKLGTGVVCTALKSGSIQAKHVDDVISSMIRTNAKVSVVARRHGLACATDVTGFGLAGHAAEVSRASGLTMYLEGGAVAVFPAALQLFRSGLETGGGTRNKTSLEGRVLTNMDGQAKTSAIFDPQTSGGLLLTCMPDQLGAVLADLNKAGEEAAVIGQCVERETGVDVVVF